MPANAAALRQRRLVPRHSWLRAHDRLRRSQEPYEAHALHDQHAVLVITNAVGARALGSLGAVTQQRAPDPTPQQRLAGVDLDAAFARAAEQSRHGRRAGAKRA